VQYNQAAAGGIPQIAWRLGVITTPAQQIAVDDDLRVQC